MARFVHLRGLTPYPTAHALQRELVDQRARGEIEDTVLLLQHEEVITLGRARGSEYNVVSADTIPVVPVERGGDATWHGPGQLVAYPIVLLQGPRADLHGHLRSIEQAVIDLLEGLGLAGCRDARNTGVWLPSPDGEVRKVCSVGIACRKWVSWHGLALNVAPDLARFHTIRPCGFDPGVMTRVCDHLQPCPPTTALVTPLARCLADALELSFREVEEG